MVDEVAEGALQGQGLGGEGAGVRAEKLKLGKQKAEIAWRRARRSVAASCPPRLSVPRALLSGRLSAFCILHATFGLLIWALEFGVRLGYNTPR